MESKDIEILKEREDEDRKVFPKALSIHLKQLNLVDSNFIALSNEMYDEVNSPRALTKIFCNWLKINYPEGISWKEADKAPECEVISHTVIRSFRMMVKWRMAQQNKENRPYLLYRTAGDNRVREEHKKFNGIILPIDHPFWEEHYPPNGWGCRCGIRTVSERDLKKKGWEITPEHEIKEIMLATLT